MDGVHILNLLVMGNDSTVPVTAAGSYITSYTDLDDGAFSVVNDENMVLSAATVLTNGRVPYTGIRLIGRYGTKLVLSDNIKRADIVSYRGIPVITPVEQVTHIGFDGTSSSIEAINNNLYSLRIFFEQQGRTGQGLRDIVAEFYRSDSTATAAEVAYGLSSILVKTLARQPEAAIKVEVLNSFAVTATNGTKTGQEVIAVTGTKFLTFETDLTYHAAGNATLVVGDLLRMGAVGAGTALTSPVYKVVGINGLVVEVDRPITNASGIYDDAGGTSDIEVIPTANIANFGIKLTGIASAYVRGKKPYKKAAFTVGLDNFGSTTVTYTTAMKLGQGVDKQIMDLEWFTNGIGGDKYRGDYMFDPGVSRVIGGDTYKQIAISWVDKGRNESIEGMGNNPKQLIIAMDTLTDNNDANDIIVDVLDAYAGAVGFAVSGMGV